MSIEPQPQRDQSPGGAQCSLFFLRAFIDASLAHLSSGPFQRLRIDSAKCVGCCPSDSEEGVAEELEQGGNGRGSVFAEFAQSRGCAITNGRPGVLECPHESRNNQIRLQPQPARKTRHHHGDNHVGVLKALNKGWHGGERVASQVSDVINRTHAEHFMMVRQNRDKWWKSILSDESQGSDGSGRRRVVRRMSRHLCKYRDCSRCFRPNHFKRGHCAKCTPVLFVVCHPLGPGPGREVVGCSVQFRPPSWLFITDPFQQIGKRICSDVAHSLLRLLYSSFNTETGQAKFVHPFTQPLPPILRLALPRAKHDCKQRPNQPNPDQQQVKSSLLHGPNNMLSYVPKASAKGAMECGDLSPLCAPGDLSPGRACSATGFSRERCVFLRSTATSRLGKAVTSHRTPRHRQSAVSPFRVFSVFRGSIGALSTFNVQRSTFNRRKGTLSPQPGRTQHHHPRFGCWGP